MPNGTLTGWPLVFAEDFNTNVALGSWPTNQTAPAGYTGWSAYANGVGDTRFRNGDANGGIYRPGEVLSVTGGCLDWYIHSASGEHKVADPLPPALGPGSEGGQLYGRYVTRMRSDVLPAYKTAWLLWPDSETWPRDGEIDFPEGDLDYQPSCYVHYQDATTGGEQDVHANPYGDTYASWHTYVTEWWPNYLKTTLDGKGFGTTWWRVPNTAMHWALETETTLGTSTIPDNATAGHVQLDWLVQRSFDTAYTPPQVVGGFSGAGAASSSIVMTVPTVANGGAYKATASGDMLLATVYAWGASAVTPPSGWTQIGATQSVTVPGQGVLQQKTYWRLWDGSTATYTFTTTGAAWREGHMGVLRGQNATPVDAENSTTNASASTTVANSGVTATAAVAVISVGCIGDSSAGATFKAAPEPGDSGWIGRAASSAMSVDPMMPGATGARTGSASTSQLSLTQVIAVKS